MSAESNEKTEPAATAENSVKTEVKIHPLLAKGVRIGLPNWPAWREAFDKASVEEWGNLIHIGFNVPFYTSLETGFKVDRILFYMDLADGHKFGHFERQSESSQQLHTAVGTKEPSRFRRDAAQKAFSVLVKEIFGLKRSDSDVPPDWVTYILQPLVIEKLLWFFRVTHGVFGKTMVANIPSEDKADLHEATMRFLEDLCRFAWDYKRCSYRGCEFGEGFVSVVMDAVRPRLIPIMDGLGILHILLEKAYTPSEADMAALHQLVMNREINIPGFRDKQRKPENIKEALVGRTVAANVLYTLTGLQSEETRFQKLAELEHRRQELEQEERELQELTT